MTDQEALDRFMKKLGDGRCGGGGELPVTGGVGERWGLENFSTTCYSRL